MVLIKEIHTNKELKQFIKFPFTLYKNYKYWIPPLIFDEWNTFCKDKNPSLKYTEVAYFLAYKDGEIVGRVAAIINLRANEKFNDKHVRFGWLEFIDDIEVSRALLDTVLQWGKERGMEMIHGPMGFTDFDPEGMLIDGFEKKSPITSFHNFPYYPEHLEKLGYKKAVDWIQYKVDATHPVPEKIERVNKLISEKYNLRTIIPKTRRELLKYGMQLFYTINASFRELYGFVDLTDEEIHRYIKAYLGFVRPEFTCIVLDEHDKLIGFGLSIPSLSTAFQKAYGKLYPFGFIYILNAMRKNEEIDLYFNGVLPEWQKKGVNSLYFSALNNMYIKKGIKIAYSTNQLEDNAKADNIWSNYDNELYQRRRCYEKSIE